MHLFGGSDHENSKGLSDFLDSPFKILVPLTDEILNLWNDFLEIVDYLQSTPQISKIIESI